MIKKLFLVLIPLCILFSFTVNAESLSQIEPYGDFYTVTENKEEVAEIINIPLSDIDGFCKENHIEYIAVNSDNSKQIRITANTTDFSNSIVNISLLSSDKISALVPDIIGVEGAKGEIIDKNGQKFIKTELRSSDSGGDFILTQYFTIADKQAVNLSFFTSFGSNTDYIEKTFESFNNSSFINTDSTENRRLSFLLPICVVILTAVCIIVTVSIIKDLRSVKILKSK